MFSSCGDIQALTGIAIVTENDIICGRSGLALKHHGNAAYRKIVGLNKELYATCLKTEKLQISQSVVAAIREINGRFLEREDGKTSSSLDEKDENGNPVTWCDIGDKRAVEKTSQALREGQPKLLKKLAQQQDGGPMQNANSSEAAPQSQSMPQVGHMQSSQQNISNNLNRGGVQIFGQQPLIQDTFQSQQRPSLTAQQQPSFTLDSLMEGQANGFAGNKLNSVGNQQRTSLTARRQIRFTRTSLMEGETFSTFPRNSLVEDDYEKINDGSNRHESWHDSWGCQNVAPLGLHDPTPLPYIGGEASHVFSTDDQQQLMGSLGVAGGNDSNRPSVSFQLEPQRPSIMSAMSLVSVNPGSVFSSEAHSLDTAMDAAQREAEFEMLGEFGLWDEGEVPIVTFEIPNKPSRSSLQRSSTSSSRIISGRSCKWTTRASFPPAPLNHNVDPGMIFTSTMDIKPGGINSGTDVSGLLGERRKSVVAGENDVHRRRSSRMSMIKKDVDSRLSMQSDDYRQLMAGLDSGMDDVGAGWNRDSILSIQSSDIMQLMQDVDGEIDDDSV